MGNTLRDASGNSARSQARPFGRDQTFVAQGQTNFDEARTCFVNSRHVSESSRSFRRWVRSLSVAGSRSRDAHPVGFAMEYRLCRYMRCSYRETGDVGGSRRSGGMCPGVWNGAAHLKEKREGLLIFIFHWTNLQTAMICENILSCTKSQPFGRIIIIIYFFFKIYLHFTSILIFVNIFTRFERTRFYRNSIILQFINKNINK